MHYGVPIDIVKHLSVWPLKTFRPLSKLWHRFLGLTSSQKEEEMEKREGIKDGIC